MVTSLALFHIKFPLMSVLCNCRNDDGEYVSTSSSRRRNGSIMLAKVLQYLDCPQYLRKSFFPQQPDLKYAGKLVVEATYIADVHA